MTQLYITFFVHFISSIELVLSMDIYSKIDKAESFC